MLSDLTFTCKKTRHPVCAAECETTRVTLTPLTISGTDRRPLSIQNARLSFRKRREWTSRIFPSSRESAPYQNCSRSDIDICRGFAAAV